ncbi:VOC family protein [Cohaesibacter celericrescens]|uniref:Uncharacterized protein n=1 Tax=Cohaesibacter celericrescens TaxID=2067669 RepID=A0A2N5XRL0_9HYPH|nr:hypothetical protein [Cohaesibacter celericrescens]PLW77152.1 hypothetical protein C0081_11110 [Cohaesibacter celericrescens]
MKKEFHHIGIPSALERSGETYMEGARLYVTDPMHSDQKIEWLRFEDGSPMPDLIQNEAHVAFLVDNVEEAMEGKPCLLDPFDSAPGVRVGFVIEDGQPVEFLSIATV